jgi:hypothetical protein
MSLDTLATVSLTYVSHARRRAAALGRVGESAVLLVAAAVAQRWIAMPRWSWLLGDAQPHTVDEGGLVGDEGCSPRATTVEGQVVSALARAGGVLPFRPSCLAQAAAAQVMLRRRGEPGVVVIGLKRPSCTPQQVDLPRARSGLRPTHRQVGRADSAPWEAHAWVLGSAGVLLGGDAAEGFTPTTDFRVRPSGVPAGPGA